MDLSRKVACAIARVGSFVDDGMKAGPSSYELGFSLLSSARFSVCTLLLQRDPMPSFNP